jgi:hypothetical protein
MLVTSLIVNRTSALARVVRPASRAAPKHKAAVVLLFIVFLQP